MFAFFGIGTAIGIAQQSSMSARATEIDAQRLETGMVNQESGLRGYKLTGQQDFLQPYLLGRTQAAAATKALDKEETRPAGKRELKDLEASVATWQAWAEQQVASVDAGGAALDVTASEQGRALFDKFRTEAIEYVDGLAAAASKADAQARSQSIIFLAVLAALVLAGVVSLAVFSTRFFRATLTPLVNLVDVAAAIATGSQVEVPGTRRRDEVGRLARSLAAWQESAAVRLNLAQAMLEVSSEVDLERVVELGVNRIRSAVGAAEVFVRLRSADDGVVYSSTSQFDPKLGEEEQSPGRVAMAGGKALRTDLRDKRWAPSILAWARELDLGPALIVPMVSGGETIGVVSVVRRAGEPAFSSGDAELAGIIVPGFAAGVNVSQLFAGLHDANLELEHASRVKSEFLANMSHELRTPLNAILGFSELLIDDRQGHFNELTREEFLKTINTSGQHLLGLINDILDLAKIEAGRMEVILEPMDFGNAIAEVLDSMAAVALNKQIKLVKKAKASLRLRADPRLVRQILLNLVSNALKFTPEEGRVTVGAALRESELEFYVEDTGVGIPPEEQERIFGEFEQVHTGSHRGQQGTGLGLALTRRMLALQGGRIWVESEPGKGATFRAVLPLRPAEEEPALPEPLAGDGPLVLVIEDDASAASLIAHQLSTGGFRSVVAKDGRQALELARKLAPYAITLDIILPELDGWEVLRTLKMDPRTREIPVVVISILDDKVTGRALGAADYFVKPVEPQALLAGLARYNLTTKAKEGTVKVLAVDDEPSALDLMDRVLGPRGFTVIRATTGADAVRLANLESPAAIVLDLMMPGMSGFEVVTALKAKPETADIPILVVTSKDLTFAEKGELNGSVAKVLQKGSLASVDIVTWLRQAAQEIEAPA
jgi:signal transduction histidine kinase/DNA-binding response OmpR family regulator/CHASE3 domain sensor protein